jgi:hypothetical protein
MKRNDLDHAFDPTPRVFTDRLDAVLRALKEDEPVKKFTLRTAAVALSITMLLCSVAYAIVSMQGQEWYYDNHFTNLQKVEPDKYQAIIGHLETEVVQQTSEDSIGLVDVIVQDYAWVRSENLFTLSVAARVKDGSAYELHPMMDMDPDGYWNTALDPNNKEIRTDHWLFAKKGFGPPTDVMDDPSKKLLLADIRGNGYLSIGDSGVNLAFTSFDSFVGEDGAIVTVLEIDLSQMGPAFLDTIDPESIYPSLRLGDSGDAVKRLQEELTSQGDYTGDNNGLYSEEVRSAVMAFQAAHKLVSDGVAGPYTQAKLYEGTADTGGKRLLANPVTAAIAQYTDAQGMLALRLPYTVTPFEKNEYGAPAKGVAVFKVKIK